MTRSCSARCMPQEPAAGKTHRFPASPPLTHRAPQALAHRVMHRGRHHVCGNSPVRSPRRKYTRQKYNLTECSGVQHVRGAEGGGGQPAAAVGVPAVQHAHGGAARGDPAHDHPQELWRDALHHRPRHGRLQEHAHRRRLLRRVRGAGPRAQLVLKSSACRSCRASTSRTRKRRVT